MRKPLFSSGMPAAPDFGPVANSAVKSAERVFQVLEFFDAHRRAARTGEIAEAISMPQSSASMLLRSMVALGYLELDPRARTYLPSLRVTLLGSWLDNGPIRDGNLLRALEFVSAETANTIIVASRNGIYSHYIHVIQARTAMRFDVALGSRRLLVRSSSGFALLGRIEDAEVRALVRRTNAEWPDQRSSEDEVLSCVREARRMSYAFSRGMVTPGAGAIAMLLPPGVDRADRPLALCVSGVLDDIEEREMEIVTVMKTAMARFF